MDEDAGEPKDTNGSMPRAACETRKSPLLFGMEASRVPVRRPPSMQ